MTSKPVPDDSTRVDEAIHELNNRLTVIAGRASLMRSILPAHSQDEVDAILEAVRGCQQALQGLRGAGSTRVAAPEGPESGSSAA